MNNKNFYIASSQTVPEVENQYEQRRRKNYVTMRMIYDFTFGGLILAMSAIFFFGDKFGLSLMADLDQGLRYAFAGLCLLYGSFRIYRGIKHEY